MAAFGVDGLADDLPQGADGADVQLHIGTIVASQLGRHEDAEIALELSGAAPLLRWHWIITAH